MVLPGEAEMRETGTGSLLSQPGPPDPTGSEKTGFKVKSLGGRPPG